MSEIIEAIKPAVSDERVRKEIYMALIPPFEDQDCDTLDECLGEDPAFDRAMRDLSLVVFED